MWPNFYYLEARRLAGERTSDTEQAEIAREAALYRAAQRSGQPGVPRRLAAQVALITGRTALRIARSLDECAVAETA